jgi:hypothetical protein
MAEPAHRRGAATRVQIPALLKGVIYGPNGRPMSPSHTRRRGRIYRYYVTREAIADGYDTCPVTSLPGARSPRPRRGGWNSSRYFGLPDQLELRVQPGPLFNQPSLLLGLVFEELGP